MSRDKLVITIVSLATAMVWACSDDSSPADGPATTKDSGTKTDGKKPEADSGKASAKMCTIACTKDSDCKGMKGFGGAPTEKCDTSKHKCVQCTSDSDCPFGPKKCITVGPEQAQGLCRSCAKDADCKALNLGNVGCFTSGGFCGVCKTDADCSALKTAGMGLCREGAGLIKFCMGCQKDSDCTNGKACVVEPLSKIGLCVGCKADKDCCPFGNDCGLKCNTTSNTCECTQDSECKAAYVPQKKLDGGSSSGDATASDGAAQPDAAMMPPALPWACK